MAMAAVLAVAGGAAIGCASTQDDAESSAGAITEVEQSSVKRQSIGNCWAYAMTGWHEALHKGATGEEKNTSESWLTYWQWFDQLATGTPRDQVNTGGGYYEGAGLIMKYGLVLEKDFIKAEAEDEMSARQSKALEAVNASLASGEMKAAVERKDRKAIRKELDRAWGLDAATSGRIDAVFGEGVEKTLDVDYVNRAPGKGVIRPQDYPIRTSDQRTETFITVSLADALGTASPEAAWRGGDHAFNQWEYPLSTEPAVNRREHWKRIQRALHDRLPVLMAWTIDFNALTRSSLVSFDEVKRKGPGVQGGHMTIMHDYQAEVPGIGLLAAGTQATKEQMEAALADDTKIQFVRVKNSWGGIRPDRWTSAAIPGYHDVELAYLDGPIKHCEAKPDGSPDTSRCTMETPLIAVVLPSLY